MNIRVILFILVMRIGFPVFSQTEAQWSIIDSEYESEDTGVSTYTEASHASIDKTGNMNSGQGIQELLDRLGSAGGGTLYLSAGKYKIERQLLLPKGVVLRGDWIKPEKGEAVQGTVLMAYYGQGSEDEANAFITMEPSTGLFNLSIWYPEQNPEDIQPYPPSILYGKRGYWGNDYCNVRNVTLVNSYTGVVVSRNNGGGCPNIFNLYGTPLSRGIEIDNIADVGRLDWIDFSPDYWANSGLPGAPAKGSSYKSWIRENGTGIVMRRNDWSYTCHAFVDGYNYGFYAAESVPSAGTKPNGHNYGLHFENCGTGIYISAIADAGIMFTRVKINDCENGIVIANGTGSTAQFYACDIAASSDAIKISDGAFTKVMTQECIIRSGQVNVLGGLYSSVDGDFNNNAPQVFAGAYARILLTGNRFSQDVDIDNTSLFECKIDHNPVTFKKLPAFPDIKPRETKPAKKALYVVTDSEFGGKADAITDNTNAIQSALNKAGNEGGGIVFLPPGKYKVNGNLNIPSGVELKGASDLASVPKGQGSIIEIYAGKNDPNGTPFLKLAAKSGLRGLTFNYPEQTSSLTINPATLPQYPYCIQVTGEDVYIVNVGVRATYNGIDLFAYPCNNHYIDYFAGHVFKNAIRVGGGSENGIISNVQFNSIVMASGYEYPKFGGWPNSNNDTASKDAVYNQNWLELEFMILEDCKNQLLYNGFHYGSHKGIIFRKNNGKAPSGLSLGLGLDASLRSICFEDIDSEKGFDLINSQVVSVARDLYADTKFIETAPGFTGTAHLFSSDYWGNAKYGGVFGGGNIHLILAHYNQYGSARYLDIPGNAHVHISTTDVNAIDFVNSGKAGQVSVQSSVSALSSPTGYNLWFNNLTTGPIFSPGTTLPRSGWIATASGGNAYSAIDGNLLTRWTDGSQVYPGQWFAVDTRTPLKINTVILDSSPSANDFPNEYAVYVSENGVYWGNPIATGSKPPALSIISIPEVTTQYVKVMQTGSGKTQYWSIHEFYLVYADRKTDLAISTPESNAFRIYPNPVSDELFVDATSNILSMEIWDLTGKSYYKYDDQTKGISSHKVNISDWKSGIYIVKTQTENGLKKQKFIKK
ncbi:MAG: discoidin domain-containing protein [Tannerella sp.]|jgi:hypothetical protein|nr:discoidin domain-containing protein [Tannerella sp.]